MICILAVRWFSHHSKVSIPLIRLVAMANVSLEGVPLPTRVLALLPTLCVLQLHGGLEVPGPNLEVLVRNCQATMDCKRVRATQESVVKILQKSFRKRDSEFHILWKYQNSNFRHSTIPPIWFSLFSCLGDLHIGRPMVFASQQSLDSTHSPSSHG